MLLIATLLLPAGAVLAGHSWYNNTWYCSINATATNPVAEGSTVTHRITYCQRFTGWTTASSYLGSSRVDTAGPLHLNAGQTGTITLSFNAGGPGAKSLTGYIVSALSAYPTPSYQNGWDHIDLTVVGNPSTPSVGEDHNPDSWSTHNHPHWTWSAGASHGSIVRYEVDPTWQGSFQTTSGDWHPTLGSGSYGVRVRAQNNVGVWGPWSGTVWAHVDTSPPSTSLGLSGPAGSNGWWRGGVSASLSASDAHSGVAGTWRNLDGAGFVGYGSPFGIAGDGTHTLDYYSRDAVGNTEGTRSSQVRIDATPPSTSIGVTGPSVGLGGTTYLTGASRVALAASDATSGVAATSYDLDGSARGYAGPVAVTGPDGPRSFRAWSTDVAGNTEAARSAPLFLDNTAPVSKLLPGQRSKADPAGTYVSSATPLHIEATDAGVGVGSFRHRVGSGAWSGGSPFQLAGADGRYTVETAATDLLGNAEAPKAAALQLDNTPPDLAFLSPAPDSVTLLGSTLQLPLPDCEAGAVPCAADILAKRNRPAIVLGGSTVQLRSDASDPAVNGVASGVHSVRYEVDGQPLGVATAAPWALAWETAGVVGGEHTVTAIAMDHVGNERAVPRKVLVVPATSEGAVATVVWAGNEANEAAAPVVADPAGFALGTAAGLGVELPAPGEVPGVPPVEVPPVGVPGELPPVGPPAVPNVKPAFALVINPNAPSVDYRVGVEVDGQFVGAQGRLPP